MATAHQSPCFDCETDVTPCTGRRGCRHTGTWELYRVRPEVWIAAGMPCPGYLCIGCIEARLGRRLHAGDLVDDDRHPHPWDTPRLADRKRARRHLAVA